MLGIAQEHEVKFVFFLEARERFHGIGAHTDNLNLQRVEVLLCVAKLGRLDRSTRCVSLRIEKKQCAFAF